MFLKQTLKYFQKTKQQHKYIDNDLKKILETKKRFIKTFVVYKVNSCETIVTNQHKLIKMLYYVFLLNFIKFQFKLYLTLYFVYKFS